MRMEILRPMAIPIRRAKRTVKPVVERKARGVLKKN
jgi:hypothetical protein